MEAGREQTGSNLRFSLSSLQEPVCIALFAAGSVSGKLSEYGTSEQTQKTTCRER
jgi:hypothetical protein